MITPCEECGLNRWKTKQKRVPNMFASQYQCRNCGKIRTVTGAEKVEGINTL